MLPDSILPVPEDDIARILRDYERRLSHLETLEGGGGFEIGARAFNSAAQVIPTGAATPITFDSERFDTDGIHSVLLNTSRLTAQTAGKYCIFGNIFYQGNATGFRQTNIELNGTSVPIAFVDHINLNATAVFQIVSCNYQLAIGDYVELVAFQNSGGNLNSVANPNSAPEFMMQKIG